MRFVLICLGVWLLSLSTTRAADGPLVINEIHHSPDVKQERVAFIELFNRGSVALDLTGWTFDAGVNFTFPAGAQVAAGGYVVVAGDPAAVTAKFGVTGVLGPWTGNLSGSGERLRLRNAAGEVADEVDYQLGFPWPTVGDAPGYSIELINPDLDNSLGGNWRASAVGDAVPTSVPLIAAGAEWRYRKGTAPPSDPARNSAKLIAWRHSWRARAAAVASPAAGRHCRRS